MIELLIVALLQAVAGEPIQAEAARPAIEQQAKPQNEAQPEASETPAATEPAAPPAPQMRSERVCERMEITGRRLPQRVCRTVMVPVEADGEAG